MLTALFLFFSKSESKAKASAAFVCHWTSSSVCVEGSTSCDCKTLPPVIIKPK